MFTLFRSVFWGDHLVFFDDQKFIICWPNNKNFYKLQPAFGKENFLVDIFFLMLHSFFFLINKFSVVKIFRDNFMISCWYLHLIWCSTFHVVHIVKTVENPVVLLNVPYIYKFKKKLENDSCEGLKTVGHKCPIFQQIAKKQNILGCF